MAKKKNFWYVLVLTNEGPKFVTKVNNLNKTAEWDKLAKPLDFSEVYAKDLALGLMMNWFTAYPICAPIELDHQPYRYNEGHFEWVKNEEPKEEKKEEVEE